MALSRNVSKAPGRRSRPGAKPKPVQPDILNLTACQMLATCETPSKFEAIVKAQEGQKNNANFISVVSGLLENGYLHYDSEDGLYRTSEGGKQARSIQLKLNAIRNATESKKG